MQRAAAMANAAAVRRRSLSVYGVFMSLPFGKWRQEARWEKSYLKTG
jgi:hypothetical protein